MTNRHARLLLLLVPILILGCGDNTMDEQTAIMPQAGEPATYVSMLGADTVAVERFYRTDEVIEGTYVSRSPSTEVYRYSGTISDDGSIERLQVERVTPASNPGGREGTMWTVVVTDEGIERTIDDSTTTIEAVGTHVIPTLGRTPTAIFVSEEMARQALGLGPGEHEVFLIGPTNPRPYATIMTSSQDSLSQNFFGDPIWISVSDDGRVLSTDGSETTMKYRVSLSHDLDVDALADRWASMDAAGQGMGTASPEAVATATVGGANVEITYSQPAKRGRVIWGELVPYGETWRTGANAATHLSTDAPISIGDRRLEAGTYTLWSIFDEESAALIINEQTGQWGTQYDESRDIARIPMVEHETEDPVERFTITIHEPTSGEGQMLSFLWDTTRFSVPITGE